MRMQPGVPGLDVWCLHVSNLVLFAGALAAADSTWPLIAETAASLTK